MIAMEPDCREAESSVPADSVQVASEYEEPQGEVEQAIARLWEKAFRLPRVGRNDNFFELGGDSLLAIDLSEMLTTALSSDVPAFMIFQCPSVREMAVAVAEQNDLKD